MIQSVDIKPAAVYFSGKPLRIIIPTASMKSENFSRCIEKISRSELPEGTIVSVVISSGPDFSFAKSINYALSKIQNEDILLLNDDCFVESHSIKNLIISISERDGVVGGLLYYPNGKIQHNGGLLYFNPITIFIKDLLNGAPFNPFRGMWKAKKVHTKYVRAFHRSTRKSGKIDFVTGAFFFIPNKSFRNIGIMDENFVNGFEDSDYCLRAKKMGFDVRVEKTAEAIHEEHASLRDLPGNFIQNITVFNMKWSKASVIDLRKKGK